MAIDGPEITLEQLFHAYLKERHSMLGKQRAEIDYKISKIQEEINSLNSQYKRVQQEEVSVSYLLTKIEKTYRV